MRGNIWWRQATSRTRVQLQTSERSPSFVSPTTTAAATTGTGLRAASVIYFYFSWSGAVEVEDQCAQIMSARGLALLAYNLFNRSIDQG